MIKKDHQNLYGLILAGGAGTRLWPISREFYPKQLLKLFGDKTLIQQTFSRLKKIIPAGKIYIITTEALRDDVFFQLKGLGAIKENLLIEPVLKNTAPAIAFATQKIFDKDKFAYLAVCPADHLISPDAKFVKTVKISLKAAQLGYLVTLGVIPSYPSSEFGYIKPKISTPDLRLDGCQVEKFVEKPTKEKAEQFIKEGYFWNSGIFIFQAVCLLENIKKYLPDIHKVLRIGKRDNFSSDFSLAYSLLNPLSIDCGVMEKAKKIWVAPADFEWRDIGSWKALYDLLPKDEKNNVLTNGVIQVGCENSLLYGAPKRVLAAIGLNDLVVVDTEDAVFIAPKNKTQEIKKVFEEIKNNNLSQYRQHPTVYRPWGYYTIFDEGQGFKIKKIRVLAGEKLSLQAHQKRSEHWVVLSGMAKVQLNNNILHLGPHQSVSIPIGVKHRLENVGKEPLDIVEIQSGSYLGEDDIERFDDQYGRAQEV